MIALAAAALVTFSPNPSHFGDLVTAHVRAGATASFEPFVVRAHHGDAYVLQCLDPVCLPGLRPRVLRVAGGTVTIVPRVTAAEAAKPLRSFRRQTTPPPTSYRIAPGTLRVVLAAGALVLVAAAGALLWPVARRLVPEPRDDRTPVERALDLVRASLARDVADRRRALDLLARVLGRRPAAQEALDLAWSRPAPDAPGIETLIDHVEGRP